MANLMCGGTAGIILLVIIALLQKKDAHEPCVLTI